MDHVAWALVGRCPGCGQGKLYASFMTVAETCSSCHIRYERHSGSWTIPVVMGYTSAALVGFGLIAYYQWRGSLMEHDTTIMVASVLTGVVVYPVCKNLSLFMLWRNGFMTVDPVTVIEGGASGASRGEDVP